MTTIRRGEIYFVDLRPTKGREQTGKRPVLVVSADAINRQPLVITVIVGTKAANITRDYPTNIRVSREETGLTIDTVFLGFQLRSLDPARFIDPITGTPNPAGFLKAEKMAEVEQALKLVLEIL